jgi:predicted Zn-dependent protease
VTGLVVIDHEDAARLLERPEGADLVRGTILHELGHLVGLGHVDDPAQLMFREGGPERLGLAEGDLRGLRLLGDGACYTDWDDVVARAIERG